MSRSARPWLLVCLSILASPAGSRADDVLLKNKLVYRGTVDRDNTLRQISDGLKRIVLFDSRIERITPSEPFRNLERFAIVQPLEVHGGAMPTYAIGVQSGPWTEKGRRQFSYLGPRSKTPTVMTQAINDLGPHMVRYRGIDGFWVGQVATDQVPKEIVLGLLGRVDRTILNERQRIARFYLEAKWYAEAKVEVESIGRDFPDERERSADLVRRIDDLDARERLIEIGLIRRSRRPRALLEALRTFPTRNVAPDVLADARDGLRKEEAQVAADRKLGESLRELEPKLGPDVEKTWKRPIAEVLQGLEAAPADLRGRLDAFARSESSVAPEARVALAMSGWVVGSDRAVPSIDDAALLWKARDLARDALQAGDEAAMAAPIAALEAIALSKDTGHPDGKLDLETLTRIVQLMPPPLQAETPEVGRPITHRVANDPNASPTEYMVTLPPEYHPLRSYPTVVALHDGRGPRTAIDEWAKEAARRGYIVVAPEYLLPNMTRDYRYTASEAASVELALRDARRRYAIDSDRVYCGGSLLGANMTLDFGVAHPDLFAALGSISGVPAKYSYAYRKHIDYVPLYLVIGDLALGGRDVIFDGYAKPMILDRLDVTYVEYLRRGLENLPEEVGPIFDWFEKYSRDPYPKSFDVASARPSDARFFGVVIKELSAGRAIAPEAADNFGKNIKPARITLKSSVPSNLLNLTTNGVNDLDVWVSPKLIDFKRKLEVRINGRAFFKAIAKPEFAAMLNDLRVRGDRQQVYWLKVSTAR